MIKTLGEEKREIRVFVSSTFIDLHEERDYIIRRTFPRLADYCRKRGILFTGVDLRWGITEEQSKEGRTVRLCLDEIRKSHPFFINILGQRYGWIPTREDLEKDGLLKERYGELIDTALKNSMSITEMEIIEGVFSKPSEVKAFFFLGDEEYYRDKNVRQNIEEEDQIKMSRLRSLREKIKASPFPTFEDFKGKEELGEEVYNCLTKAIEELYPMENELTELQKERLKHHSFALSRKDYYLKNDTVYKFLADHVEQNNKPLVIWGESGTGKSALLANWASEYKNLFPNIQMIEHYVGATSETEMDLFRHILLELNVYEKLDDTTKSSKAALQNKLIEVLRTYDKKIIIIIDGINQMEDGGKDTSWITNEQNKNIVFVLSSADSDFAKQSRGRGWIDYKLKSLTSHEIQRILEDYLPSQGKSLDSHYIQRILKNEEHFKKFSYLEKVLLRTNYGEYAGHIGTPMFLRLFLNELVLYGRNENIGNQIDQYLEAVNIVELMDKVFDRLEEDFGRQLVRFILGHIYVSRVGISEQELRILAESQKISYIDMVECINNLTFHLMNRGDLLDFFHLYIREAVEKRYVSSKEEEFEFRKNLVHGFKSLDSFERKLEEVPYQLFILDDWEELKRFISDSKVFGVLSKEQPYTLNKYIRRIMLEDSSIIDDLLRAQGINELQQENLAEFLYDNRSYYAAEKLYRALYIEKMNLLGEEHPEVSRSLKNIIKVLIASESYDKALTFAERDIEFNSMFYGESSLQAAKAISNLALVKLKLNKVQKAVRLFEKSRDMKKEFYSADSMEMICAEEKIYHAKIYDMEGNYKIRKNEYKQTEGLGHFDKDLRIVKLKEILALKKKLLGDFHLEIVNTNMIIGDYYSMKKDKDNALCFYLSAGKCFKEIYGENHLLISDIYIKQENYRQAWLVRQNILGLQHVETLKALELYERSLDMKMKEEDALLGEFLNSIKGKAMLPSIEQLDDILDKPKLVRKHNNKLRYRYFMPNTVLLFSYLLVMSEILPVKWLTHSLTFLNILIIYLGYNNGRNKNYIAFFDIAFFSFIPIFLVKFLTYSSNVIISTFSYGAVMLWIHKFSIDAFAWLALNLRNVDPQFILHQVMPKWSYLTLGLFRFCLFSVMMLLGLLDAKFEFVKKNINYRLFNGGLEV